MAEEGRVLLVLIIFEHTGHHHKKKNIGFAKPNGRGQKALGP